MKTYPKYKRITLHMKDPNTVEPSNAMLIFLPGLTQVLTVRSSAVSDWDVVKRHPLDPVVDGMV